MIPCGRSSASKYRSNREIPVSTSIWVRFQPGRGGGRGGSRMNMTWNNGSAGISIGLQALHHLLDRDIAAGERLERRLAHVPQKLPEAEILRQTRPEHQRVEEEAQEALELGPAAARGHRPDEDVLLARVAVEQDVERGQERHEERRLLPPRERLELFAQSLR